MDSSESCHSSSSSLYYADADTLRAKLDEKNALLITAAQYGKDLLDQNRELSQSLEDLNRKYTRQIEILKEDNYSLTQRLEQKSRMEDEYQEEIESLKKHLSSQRDELKVLNDLKDQSSLIGDLRQRIRDVEATADRLEVENSQLKSLTTSQQEQIEETSSKIKQLQESVNDAASDEMSDLYRELNEATALSEELSRDCSHKDNQMQSLTQQLESHVQKIESLHDELNEANSQLSSISNSFMASTQENQELRCEIDLLRMNDRDHKKKGNSMFSELDDKRQEAEKKLLLLNVQYESVVNQYDLSKKQMNKLKLQMSNILRLASGQVDSNHVEVLESQLNEARNEIQTLSTKLTKISSDEARREPQSLLQSSAGASGGGDHRTVQFVESLLKTKDEDLRKVKRELEEKRLAVTYSGQELNDTQHRLRSLEGKVNQLHAQNIQLSVKVEELKTKYEDESTGDTHLERGRVEDIPDYNPEIAQALLGSASRSTESLHSQKTRDNLDTADDTVSVKEDTFSDNHSLEDIHNITEKTSDKKSVSCSPSKLSPKKAALQRPPGRYFSSENRSPLSSTDSLLDGGQVNAKSYDNSCAQGIEKKVINVSSKEQDPNNCATQ